MVRGINLNYLSSSGFNLINGQTNKYIQLEKDLCEPYKD